MHVIIRKVNLFCLTKRLNDRENRLEQFQPEKHAGAVRRDREEYRRGRNECVDKEGRIRKVSARESRLESGGRANSSGPVI